MQPYAPIGTLYAASALRQQGISVAVFDSMLENPDGAFAEAVGKHRPKVVAVYEDDFNFLSKMCLTRMREVAFEIAMAARNVGASTIVHGSDSTDNPEVFLKNGFDYVLCGEAEETLAQLCIGLLQGEERQDIHGLVRMNCDGLALRDSQPMARNLKWPDLPLPARDLIDLERYRTAWTTAHGYFSTNMVSSRGCPYHCNWCAKPISGNRFQLRPAAAVAEEMRILKVEAKVDHIWFGDDVFALNQHWIEQFAAEVTRRHARVPFKIQSRADLMSEQTVQHLKQAGCCEIWMGVESGAQSVLIAMEKGLHVSSVITARQRLKEAGIRACFFLQFGYPGETWRELQQTIALVRETRPDDVGISFSYPLPGTGFYERVREQLGSKRNWTDSDDLCIMFKAAYTTNFYRAVRDALHTEVDSWRAGDGDPLIRSRIDELWQRVERLEPISRQSAVDDFEGEPPRASVAIVPLSALATAGGA
jgi:anaerobic magnesium-protoporphyrin IX monomethyl ester cyclase